MCDTIICDNGQSLVITAAIGREQAIWIVLAVLLVMGGSITYWAYQRRRVTWKKFARKHGLSFRVDDSHPVVFGELAGRPFELRTASRSSDRGLGIEEVVMQLKLNTDVPVKFDLTNEGACVTALREASGDDEVVHVGPDDFDQRTCLHTEHESEFAAFLTETRRSAILRLMEECRTCHVHVTQSLVEIRERTMGKSPEILEHRCALMSQAADELESLPAPTHG